MCQSRYVESQRLQTGEYVITVQNNIHNDYGLSYPVTFEFDVPEGYNEIKTFKKNKNSDSWELMSATGDTNFVNGVELARLENNILYASVAFSSVSDSIYFKFVDSSEEMVDADYRGIAEYYDNRRAVITCSADDWQTAFDPQFNLALDNFRQYKIPVSVGIISAFISMEVWNKIQNQLDRGFVEAAAHSRNHLHAEYPNPEFEIGGCKGDITRNLDLPAQYKKGDNEYVYTWIAPYGDYTDEIDSKVKEHNFLVSRMYESGDSVVGTWNNEEKFFSLIGHTEEVGAPVWGGGETNPEVLNGIFDNIYNHGGVYHFMCHPDQVKNDWYDGSYLHEHLSYISEREDVWYATLGHLYLYQMIYQNALAPVSIEEDNTNVLPQAIHLSQNYPNPFNPTTRINYRVDSHSRVKLIVYNTLGEIVKVLVDEMKEPGLYSKMFDGSNLSSGMYFYSLFLDDRSEVKKMILIK